VSILFSRLPPRERSENGRPCQGGLVLGGLSAVSEAPASEELRVVSGALRIQRLEGKPPRGLWDLYLDEPVLVVSEFAVAVRALGFH
jgi:hypothetical protein